VPAAAVIPAPIAYIKVVAVKKLVVGFLSLGEPPTSRSVRCSTKTSSSKCLTAPLDYYFEEIRVFQAGTCLEYISME